jgi:hypothetical protein
MAYIDNIKFKEILEASRNGNEKAKMVMQGMRKMAPQEDIDRLVLEYYNVPVEAPVEETLAVEDEMATISDMETVEEATMGDSQIVEPEIITETDNAGDVVDITDLLKGEMEGLVDEDEYTSVSFTEYLHNKMRDANRAKKNTDYFKAFDMDGRHAYADDMINSYRDRFSGNLRDIERSHADNDKALALYSQKMNDSLDDGVEFNTDTATSAYTDLIGNEMAMSSFGRHWDDNDTEAVLTALGELANKYGKANVIAALNVLRGDNDAHRDYLNNMIDTNIGKYTKSIDKLLR